MPVHIYGQARARLWNRGLFPFQGPLLPNIDEAEDKNEKKHHHLYESEPTQLSEQDRPGIQKDGLDIEQKEHHGDQIEFDGKSHAGLPDRVHPALEGLILDRIRFPRPDEDGQGEEHPGQAQGEKKQDSPKNKKLNELKSKSPLRNNCIK